MTLYESLCNQVSVIHCTDGILKVNAQQSAYDNLQYLEHAISKLTESRWSICTDNSVDGTVYGVNARDENIKFEDNLKNHPLTRKITQIFPDLEISAITRNVL